jgi:hypothetical protein
MLASRAASYGLGAARPSRARDRLGVRVRVGVVVAMSLYSRPHWYMHSTAPGMRRAARAASVCAVAVAVCLKMAAGVEDMGDATIDDDDVALLGTHLEEDMATLAPHVGGECLAGKDGRGEAHTDGAETRRVVARIRTQNMARRHAKATQAVQDGPWEADLGRHLGVRMQRVVVAGPCTCTM